MTHNPKPGDIITVDNLNRFTCCTYEQLIKRYQHVKDDWDIYGIAIAPGHGWEGWRGDGSNESIGYNIATITPATDTDTTMTPQDPALQPEEDLLPAPGETFITASGLKLLCVTREDLLKACPSAQFSGRNFTTLGLVVGSTKEPAADWQGWPCNSTGLKIVEIIREPTSWAPEPGDLITTVEGVEYTCCTREELAKALGARIGHISKREYYGMRNGGHGALSVYWLGWPLAYNEPKHQIASVKRQPKPQELAQPPLPTIDPGMLAYPNFAEEPMPDTPSSVEEPAKPTFNPLPGDTIVTANPAYIYVCCTKEHLQSHYGIGLSEVHDIYGYRPAHGGLGAAAMGWNRQGQGDDVASEFDIQTVITVLGNKPKFKGVLPKQTLLDHLATLDDGNIRIRNNPDGTISIE